MKKLSVIALALILALLAACACAEVSTYVMVGVQDADGNVLTYEEIEEFPVLVFAIDGETDACAFGDEETQVAGTYVISDEAEDSAIVTATLEDDEVIALVYVKSEDSFAYVDEEGYVYVMVSIDALTEEEAA